MVAIQSLQVILNLNINKFTVLDCTDFHKKCSKNRSAAGLCPELLEAPQDFLVSWNKWRENIGGRRDVAV